MDRIGIGFMFAPALHPAMKHVMPARKALAIRTVFNILGPLCNPAGAQRQVIGLFDGALTEPLAEVLKKLGAKEALLVHGDDGLDELTTTTTTQATQLHESGQVNSSTIDAQRLGLKRATLADLQGGSPEHNATMLREILQGQPGPKRDIVVLNAAAGLMVGGKARDLAGGIALANQAIDSGKALATLDRLVDF